MVKVIVYLWRKSGEQSKQYTVWTKFKSYSDAEDYLETQGGEVK